MPKRIGIFGGSFNPVHTGHCIIAEQFAEQMLLDSCLLIPTFISPFKIGWQEQVTPMQRLRMLAIVARDNPRFHIDDVELRRKGISYTIETIQYLREKHGSAQLFLLIGGDQARDFCKWRQWQEILHEVQLCIARRPFMMTAEEEKTLLQELSIHGKQPVFITMPEMEISSKAIRERIRSGQSIRYMVPSKVVRYIKKHKLYRAMHDNGEQSSTMDDTQVAGMSVGGTV